MTDTLEKVRAELYRALAGNNDHAARIALIATFQRALFEPILELHRPWYEFNGVRHDSTVLVTGDAVPADHVCRTGPGHQSCITYDGHPEETEHEVLACIECRATTEDGDPGVLLWPCPTVRAINEAKGR